jgi:hypothetical protein
MSDGVRQHAGEFRFAGRVHEQRRRNEEVASGKGDGLMQSAEGIVRDDRE